MITMEGRVTVGSGDPATLVTEDSLLPAKGPGDDTMDL